MKKSRFTEEQVVAILAEADRGETTIGEVCRSHGIFVDFVYEWLSGRKGRDLPAKQLLGGSIALSMVVTAIQYTVLYRGLAFSFYGALGGVALGSLGAVVYLFVEKGIKGREDPRREKRCQKSIRRQAFRYKAEGDLSLPPLDGDRADPPSPVELPNPAARD